MTLRELERKDVMIVDSEARNLHYVLDNDREGIVIKTKAGMVGLNRKQMMALSEELSEIIDVYFGD